MFVEVGADGMLLVQTVFVWADVKWWMGVV